MSGKFQNKTTKKKKNKRLPIVLAGIAVVLLAAVIVMLMRISSEEEKLSAEAETQIHATVQDETVQIQQEAPVRTSLGNNLEILDMGSYTGAYVEDGTDEILAGILMLKVVNNGEKTVEYAKITMELDGERAEFAISTLKPGATIVILEKNRMQYDRTVNYAEAQVHCENLAMFEDPLNSHEDKLKIQILDGAINVTNISGEDIAGKIAIYYKNVADNIYYGGITYRVLLENGLKADEVRQIMASHFSDTGSEIVFVTVAQ